MKRGIKIALIIATIAVVIGGGVLLWQFFMKPSSINESTNLEDGALQTTPKAITANEVFDYWINKKTGEVFYLTEGGQIYKINSEGREENTGSKATGNLSYVKPSTDGSMIIVAFGFPHDPTFAIYNTSAKSWQALPAGTTAAAWDPKSNDRLAYLRYNGSASKLYLLNFKNNRSTEELRLSQKDLELEWPSPDLIYLSERPSIKYPTSLWSYNLKTKTINTVIREEKGLITKWFNDKNALKFSDGLLKIIDNDNQFLALVNFITLPSKCAIDPQTEEMFCAAPEISQLSRNITNNLPDNYLKKQIHFDDLLYLVPLTELESGQSNLTLRLPLIDLSADADHLELVENNLYFIDRYDKKLYKLEL